MRRCLLKVMSTRTEVSGSRTSEVEAELLSADVGAGKSYKRRSCCLEWVHSEGNGSVYRKRSRMKTLIGWMTKLVGLRKAKGRRKQPPLELIITPGWKESLSCVNMLKNWERAESRESPKHRSKKEERRNAWESAEDAELRIRAASAGTNRRMKRWSS